MASDTDALQKRRAHHVNWCVAIEPNGKRESSLMQQHRQPVCTAGAGFFSCSNQSRFRWAIYRVENHVMRREQARSNRRWITRIHSQWRCIYDKIDILKLCTQ